MKTTKVCIVGAGPGGISTALALAKRGIAATLIDKAIFPRDKVDGDVMPGIILRALNEIDPKYVRLVQTAACMRPLKGVQIFSGKGKRLTLDYKLINVGDFKKIVSCYACTRSDFDNLLLNEIKNEPLIELIEGQSIYDLERVADGVVLFDKKRTFQIKTELVIVANGANSRLARNIGGIHIESEHHGLGVRAYFKGVEPLSGVPYGDYYSELYALFPNMLYFTPLPNGLTNINLGIRADVVKKKKIQLRHLILETVDGIPSLKERFRNAEMVGAIKGHSLPFGTKKRQLAGERYLVVGDAGAMIDLTSGNGIGNAMWSGIFAAEQVEKSLTTNDFSEATLMDYHEAVHKKLANDLHIGRLIASWYGRTRLYGLYQWIINQAIGLSSSSDVLSRLLYESELDKKLKQPSFYYQLFFK